jgi:hypothetical protein
VISTPGTYEDEEFTAELGPSILLFLLAGTGSMIGAGGLAIVTVLVTTCLRVIWLRGLSMLPSFGDSAVE